MFNRKSCMALLVLAVFSLAATCEEAAQAPRIISPQGAQLLRDAEAFAVEIDANPQHFDLSTLEASLNGDALDVVLGESIHSALLGNGQQLDAHNEVIVSALRRVDGQTGTSRVAFDWEILPPALDFNSEYVTKPPRVESATVQLLDPTTQHQNALLQVRYRPGAEKPSQIPYRVDDQTVYILRDDGNGEDDQGSDGLYSAIIDFDFNAYALRKARNLMGPGGGTAASGKTLFDGRKLVSQEPLDVQADLTDLLGQGQGDLITVFPLPATRSSLDHEQALLVRHPSILTDPDLTFDPCDIDGDGNLGNPDGPWTFKTLMTAMANEPATGISPEEFVREWVRGFESDPNGTQNGWAVNRDLVPARPNVNALLDGWLQGDPGELNLDVSPFRLLAIVNRLDLREAVGYGGPGTAGELRFVFGLVEALGGSIPVDDPPIGSPGSPIQNTPVGDDVVGEILPGPIPGAICGTRRMTVIFEYKVDSNSCQDVLAYAEAWENLDLEHTNFSELDGEELASFKDDLLAITDQVVEANRAPTRPNGNAIGQIRTNEFVMGSPWEMREFTLQGFGDIDPTEPHLSDSGFQLPHVLRLATAKQTPDLDYAQQDNAFMQGVLRDFINNDDEDVRKAICNEEHQVPASVLVDQGSPLPIIMPFLAGRADFMPGSVFDQASTHFSTDHIENWDDPDPDGRDCAAHEMRFNFSAATCTGCHGADILDPTVDTAFYHVNPNEFTLAEGAGLSRFLTGTEEAEPPRNTPVPDPSDYSGRPQHFFDLARRADDMDALLATQCVNLMVASRPDAAFVH